MAEATDRPQGTADIPEQRVFAPEEGETYRPLSLLALAGFAVAVLYAFAVLLGGAIALFNRVPWLLPAWTFFIPFAALALCWLARARIRDSEGTLSGLAFTTWGVRLAILIGLTYTAYYAFTFVAVRLQAIDCADQFFTQLRKNNPGRAFLLAMNIPANDIEDSEVRNTVEGRFNSSSSQIGNGGVYDQFRSSSYVRAIALAGDQARIAPTGVNDWGYEGGGYRVALQYHISTPLVEFDMDVVAFGPDSPPGETRGRQWHVVLPRSETKVIPASMKVTPRGEDYMNDARMAWSFASTWQDKINRLDWEDAYLDTLDPSQRESLRKGQRVVRLRATAPLAGPAALGLYGEAGRDFLAERHTLAQSKLIQLDEGRFWSNKQQRAAILDCIKNTFHLRSGGAASFSLRLQQTHMPASREADGRAIVLLDVHLIYLNENSTRPRYFVDGQLVVSAPAAEAGRSPSVWRVDAIELEKGRTPPQMQRPQPEQGAPPMGGAGPP